MNILFIHQNFPGQFRHLAAHLAQKPGWNVVGLGDASNLGRVGKIPGVHTIGYRHSQKPPEGHAYLRGLENQVRRGQSVLRALLVLKKNGFTPDIICAHPSWGEAMFLREAFPQSKIVNYCEFFYHSQGADVGFDPEFQSSSLDAQCRLRLRNTSHLLALEDCDIGWTPSLWQAQQLPEVYQPKVSIIHEGIDTRKIQPKADASFQHQGLSLSRADSVLTYVARNLEPYRGFHIFMRSLPKILAANPGTQVVIVGGDEVSYGQVPVDAKNWRTKLLAEVGSQLDLARVHFVGKLPYEQYLSLLQVSTVHIYLTYPFVLSWSFLEAMAAGCALLASRTAPVEEVIEHGQNGLLVGFFDTGALAEAVGEVLANPEAFNSMRSRARETVQTRYELNDICLPKQVAMLEKQIREMNGLAGSEDRYAASNSFEKR